MYHRILNPITKKTVSINSIIGKKILKNYIKQYLMLGGFSSQDTNDILSEMQQASDETASSSPKNLKSRMDGAAEMESPVDIQERMDGAAEMESPVDIQEYYETAVNKVLSDLKSTNNFDLSPIHDFDNSMLNFLLESSDDLYKKIKANHQYELKLTDVSRDIAIQILQNMLTMKFKNKEDVIAYLNNRLLYNTENEVRENSSSSSAAADPDPDTQSNTPLDTPTKPLSFYSPKPSRRLTPQPPGSLSSENVFEIGNIVKLANVQEELDDVLLNGLTCMVVGKENDKYVVRPVDDTGDIIWSYPSINVRGSNMESM